MLKDQLVSLKLKTNMIFHIFIAAKKKGKRNDLLLHELKYGLL